ncbi:MAG: hypothetical protein ABEI52_05110, partial [Halobacteriaceae archaeon]
MNSRSSFSGVIKAGGVLFSAGNKQASIETFRSARSNASESQDDLLGGLAKYAAAIHQAKGGNWVAARNAAQVAKDQLEEPPMDQEQVNISSILEFLETMREDPEVVERQNSPPILTGEVPSIDAVSLSIARIAAPGLAVERGDSVEDVKRAIEYAEDDERFAAMVHDYVTSTGKQRDLILQRLVDHAQRRWKR